MPGPGTTEEQTSSPKSKTRVNKCQAGSRASSVVSKIPGLVMSKGLVAAANWLLGPLSFKKQIHGMDCNGNG